MDPRPSRRDKLLSIPPDHLMYAARENILGISDLNPMVVNLLKSAAQRGNREADFLLGRLGFCDFGKDWKARLRWLIGLMDDSPMSLYYQGRATRTVDWENDNAFTLLMRSAKAGFAPAASQCYPKSHTLIENAAALGDPDALFLSGQIFSAACNGHLDSMYELATEGSDRSPMWGARYVLLAECNTFMEMETFHGLENGSIMFKVGRELEGYASIWRKGRELDPVYIQCIEFYLNSIHRARRAALQTVVGLRPILGRDVACMIGKMIYGIRNE